MNKLSKYADLLPAAADDRYKQKISLIGIDPFVINEMVTPQRITTVSPSAVTGQRAIPLTILPPIDSSDLVSYMYLVLQMSFVTAKQFKAHKSMEGYNQFVCGWVKDVKAWSVNSKMCCYWEGQCMIACVKFNFIYLLFIIGTCTSLLQCCREAPLKLLEDT